MKKVVVERCLVAGDSHLAARLLLITGYKVVAEYYDWEDDSPLEIEKITFPDKHEECWFSVLGDDSMGTLVNIWNNGQDQLIVKADFGDHGQIEFNLSKLEHLQIQKITAV